MLASIQRNVTWRAVPIAALAAGTAFLIAALVLCRVVYEIEPGLVLRYFASLVMGSDILTGDGSAALIIGVIVHYALSLVFTLVVVLIVHRWGMLAGIVGGALVGAALYFINMYTMTVFFTWFFALNSVMLLAGHVLFGAVAGGVYEYFDHYDLPLGGE